MNEMTISFAGDVALFPSVVSAATRHPSGWLWEHVRPAIAADLRIANFEFPMSVAMQPAFQSSWRGYCVPTDATLLLEDAPFDAYSLANNHIMDWGIEGFETTRKALAIGGRQVFGCGASDALARTPLLVQEPLRCALLAYCKPGPYSAATSRSGAAAFHLDAVIDDVRTWSPKVDHVIVILHWGVEYTQVPFSTDVRSAHAIIDAGASCIIGHHPHVVQGIETYKQRPIFYSIGNLIFDPESERVFVDSALEARLTSMIARVGFTRESVSSWDIVPLRLRDLRPVPLDSSERGEFLERLAQLVKAIGDDSQFYADAGNNLLAREWATVRLLLRQRGLPYVWQLVRSIRWKHLRLVWGALLSQLRSRIRRTVPDGNGK